MNNRRKELNRPYESYKTYGELLIARTKAEAEDLLVESYVNFDKQIFQLKIGEVTMALLNYTTSIEAAKTVSEIQNRKERNK